MYIVDMENLCVYQTVGTFTCSVQSECIASEMQDAQSYTIQAAPIMPQNEKEMWLGGRQDKYGNVSSCLQPNASSGSSRS